MKRALTSIALVLVLVFSMLHPVALLIVIILISVLGLLEFYNIVKTSELKPPMVLASIFSASLIATVFLNLTGYISFNYLVINIAFAMLIFLRELFSNKPKPFTNIAYTILGVVYITLPLICLLWLTYYPGPQYNWHLLLSFFIIVWVYDSFAYFSGILFGKHRLYERISPKKSWEGAIGGFIFALITAYILSLFFAELSRPMWYIFASITAIFATLGDLTESMLKRSYCIKDSGKFFPGHGGVLDRFDSIFIAAPTIFIFLQLLGN